MGSTGPVTPAAGESPGRGPGGTPAAPGASSAGTALTAVAVAAARAPVTARARRELLFCLVAAALELAVLAVPFALLGLLLAVQLLMRGTRPASQASAPSAHPAGAALYLGVLLVIVLLVVFLAPRFGRGLGTVHRYLAARLLGQPVAGPAPARRGPGALRRLAAMPRDGPGWRAVAYPLVKLPILVAEVYAVFFAAVGLVNLTYPFWWRLFRNHPPGVRLQPVPVLTPFGSFDVATFAGTFAAFAAGAAMVLAAPWVARGAAAADVWLMRGMLGPGRLARRVADLEQTRALAVDDSAALLRRVERDLHDGAQIRLATVAMNLGMAREKLSDDNRPEVRELIDAAHHGAKEALIELRNLARGIHPPALDNGLAAALATLAASSAIPVELVTTIPRRPAPAIETIAYFCAAELLANATKHSHANTIAIGVTERDRMLVLRVSDDGRGGADPARGSGLSGLAQRVRTVDGSLEIMSPRGGPTQVTVQLPLHA